MKHNISASAVRLTVCLLCGPLNSAALAQDFNAAPPNGIGQTPAFEGQTRARVLPDTALQTQVIVSGLEHPWGMAQMPDGRWLVTERPGRLKIVSEDGHSSDPIAGLPDVDNRGQGGLLDVAIAIDFSTTRQVWWSFAEPRAEGKTATAVATGRLSSDFTRIENAKVIWQQQPAWDSTKHYGSRLVFDRHGGLFVTTGERSDPKARILAQDFTTTIGKIVRIDPQTGAALGRAVKDGDLPEIWSLGHRNIQGAALGPDGVLWTVEHGPKGGDELNQPKQGHNYGWPLVTYGIDYSGQPIGDGITQMPDAEQPVYYWDPVIAPGGMTFYDGAMFPDWQGDLLIGGLKANAIVRLDIHNSRVKGEGRHLQGIGRVRDIAVAADGAIMVLTDSSDGAIIRVTPRR